MKKASIIFLILWTSFLSLCSAQKPVKENLNKLKWIEGNRKGMDGENPFYDIYTLKNDSTLLITSYEWNGKDSSKSTISSIRIKDGHYYLGDEYNGRVANIVEDSMFMEPVYKAANYILWKKINQDSWEAMLESKKERKVYKMERIDHFKIK